MKLNFIKMEGCGNDYIYVEESAVQDIDLSWLSKKLSRRHFSIGGDGLVIIGSSSTANGSMTMFNADGSKGLMCGNALRCVAKYLYDIKEVKDRTITVETSVGVKTTQLVFSSDGEVIGATANMGTPTFDVDKIPVFCGGETFIDKEIDIGDTFYTASCVSVGNPHCVVVCDDIQSIEIQKIGPLFEHHKLFPERINTEFIKIIGDNVILMRVWERGSGETLACGTGACAAVVVAEKLGLVDRGKEITVKLKGGELIIMTDKYGQVFLKGPATITYKGSIEI